MAVDLKSGSDAATSEMLNHAVGEALANEPQLVLAITGRQYRLEDICNGPDVDDSRYSTYDKAVSAAEQRIDALQMVKNKELEKERAYCIQKLRESISQLRRFFDVNKGK